MSGMCQQFKGGFGRRFIGGGNNQVMEGVRKGMYGFRLYLVQRKRRYEMEGVFRLVEDLVVCVWEEVVCSRGEYLV